VDEYLYAGSAPYYAVGRMPYPHRLAEMLRDHLGLDGHGRLLDIGCGPGSLTLLLAPLFAETVGIDADLDMIAHAAQRAARAQGVTWQLRAEDLPADLGRFRVVTFAQSFCKHLHLQSPPVPQLGWHSSGLLLREPVLRLP
jgi:SAM-dependent methyltransferase